jgi:hypothetical protein
MTSPTPNATPLAQATVAGGVGPDLGRVRTAWATGGTGRSGHRIARPFQLLATHDQARALGHRFINVPVQLVPQVVARHGADISVFL